MKLIMDTMPLLRPDKANDDLKILTPTCSISCLVVGLYARLRQSLKNGGGISAPPSGLDNGDMSSNACSLMRLRLQKKTQQDIILSRQCVSL